MTASPVPATAPSPQDDAGAIDRLAKVSGGSLSAAAPQREIDSRAAPPRTRPQGVRARAVDAADKVARRASILDAAERLFHETHEFANVAQVAEEAGLAKGTVYLYFRTKEEVYLALHTRNAEGFFSELIADLEAGFPHGERKQLSFGYMRALVVKHMFANEAYFPLHACCGGMPQNSLPHEIAYATQQLLTHWLLRAGAGLERHFPQLEQGGGLRLLNHSYALMIGLYHLLGEHKNAPQRPCGIGLSNVLDEAMVGLTRYWEATLGPDPAAGSTSSRAPTANAASP